MKIRLGTVKSSLIAAIGHEGSTLRVRFVDGVICDYENVPLKVFAGFVRARSKGKFFQSKVDGVYGHRCGEKK